MKGTMETMTRLKMKLAIGVITTALLVGGVAIGAAAPTKPAGKLTPSEIFAKARKAYASLTSYSDEGKTVASVNGMTFTTTFSIKLARPNLYRIEWAQPVDFFTNTGVVWSAGHGNFMITGKGHPEKEPNRGLALASATGVSGGAAAIVPGTFFRMNWGNQLGGTLQHEKQEADGVVDGVACYVFTSTSKGRTNTLWIGKRDFLIHQRRTATSAASMKAAIEKAAKVAGVHPQIVAQAISSTETHTNIVVNQKFSPSDFAGMR